MILIDLLYLVQVDEVLVSNTNGCMLSIPDTIDKLSEKKKTGPITYPLQMAIVE